MFPRSSPISSGAPRTASNVGTRRQEPQVSDERGGVSTWSSSATSAKTSAELSCEEGTFDPNKSARLPLNTDQVG